MNLYFVVEGKTEYKVYPSYLTHYLPKLKKVNLFPKMEKNNYYIFQSMGIPTIYDHIKHSIDEIIDNPIVNYLIICVDADDNGVEKTIERIKEKVDFSTLQNETNCNYQIIVQNICIETWFLGNRKIVTRSPQNPDLVNMVKHYSVLDNDPELLRKPDEWTANNANYHLTYLKKVFEEKNLYYVKNRPKFVTQNNYFNELCRRIDDTNHLQSFASFIHFLERMKREMGKS